MSYSAWALPAVLVSSFQWDASGRFHLTAQVGSQEAAFQGWLRDGETAADDSGSLHADLKSYVEGFVLVAISQKQSADAELVLMERQNAEYVLLTSTAIPTAQKTSAISEFQSALDSLKAHNGWDVAISIRAVAAYFSQHTGARLMEFLKASESGAIVQVPKPKTRVSLVGGPSPGEPHPVHREATREQPQPSPSYDEPYQPPQWQQPGWGQYPWYQGQQQPEYQPRRSMGRRNGPDDQPYPLEQPQQTQPQQPLPADGGFHYVPWN